MMVEKLETSFQSRRDSFAVAVCELQIVFLHFQTPQNQMPYPLNDLTDRLKSAISAWRTSAPDAVFAGMTLTEFEAANEAPLRLRREIENLTVDLIARKVKRDQADVATRASLQMLSNSVKGTQGYGPNSPLYGALGYVRDGERKSGLVRKSKKQPPNVSEI